MEREELRLYEQALAEINRQRPHVLPAEQEALLAEAGFAVPPIHTNAKQCRSEFPVIKDENGEEVEITHGRFISF